MAILNAYGMANLTSHGMALLNAHGAAILTAPLTAILNAHGTANLTALLTAHYLFRVMGFGGPLRKLVSPCT
jgi:hypothetical protein